MCRYRTFHGGLPAKNRKKKKLDNKKKSSNKKRHQQWRLCQKRERERDARQKRQNSWNFFSLVDRETWPSFMIWYFPTATLTLSRPISQNLAEEIHHGRRMADLDPTSLFFYLFFDSKMKLFNRYTISLSNCMDTDTWFHAVSVHNFGFIVCTYIVVSLVTL